MHETGEQSIYLSMFTYRLVAVTDAVPRGVQLRHLSGDRATTVREVQNVRHEKA